jgi:membrane protein YdbS with pleckstrin-like domain
MNCSGCGAWVAEGSRFCNNCGAAVAAPAMQRAPRDEDLPERVIFTVRPTFLFVGVKYAIAAAVWLLATAIVAFAATSFRMPVAVGAGIVVALGLILFIWPVVAHLRRQRYVYTLTNHKLEIQYGLIATTVRNVPLSKVQDVTVTASIPERLLGLGTVSIDNASESGGRIQIAGIRDPKRYADLLMREMQRWN